MNPLKLRRALITIHLYLAGLLAPAFLIVALTGGLYLAGVKGETDATPLPLPAETQLDFKSETLHGDIQTLLSEQGVDLKFEYIRGRGNMAMTRPTSRTYVEFRQSENGLQATVHEPNLQYALMELHKGHGPRAYRLYQIVAAIALTFVVIGGLAIGLLVKTYRNTTLITFGVGIVATIFFGFLI